jgi:hypothetical protein
MDNRQQGGRREREEGEREEEGGDREMIRDVRIKRQEHGDGGK